MTVFLDLRCVSVSRYSFLDLLVACLTYIVMTLMCIFSYVMQEPKIIASCVTQ